MSLTESNIASIEEESALKPKLVIKKSDKAVPFSCFSTETEQDTMKEVQGASTVENISFKSVRTILSTVVKDYKVYQDHILSNEASEKISEKTSLKSEQPASCTKKTVSRRAPAVNNPERVGSKSPDGDEQQIFLRECCNKSAAFDNRIPGLFKKKFEEEILAKNFQI